MGQLIGKSGTLAGKKYELHSDKESSLGRSPDNTIVVDDPVARHDCRQVVLLRIVERRRRRVLTLRPEEQRLRRTRSGTHCTPRES